MTVHHIGYLVKDIDEAIREFMELGWGMEQEVRFDEMRRARIAFMILGESRIELVEPQRDSECYALMKHYKNSPYHICYEAESLEEQVALLESKGWHLTKEPQRAPCIGDRRVAFLMGYASGMAELVEVERKTGKCE